jgi:hypothetical protein
MAFVVEGLNSNSKSFGPRPSTWKNKPMSLMSTSDGLCASAALEMASKRA